ncbi:MAG: hypothetical protein COU65_00745 [Candidatus Pacebacteria bacterium CG10_big_fil_rev_8_21_14_0_10_42_12]|nr:hypothetical protein [Candidatus Paceibacterota bacterium]PIR62959.1 MAG: hypothetical protein COU65_00745 [Candidatus Pacebacteria bacterium CG10_big_fil_rev_8_21_14_0_10_42_12]
MSLGKYWHLFWKFRGIQFMKMTEYRGDFLFWSFISILWTIFNFFAFSLILRVSGNIAGWNQYEMYLLLGTFTIIDAFTWSFFFENMSNYTRQIFKGELDYLLTKPVDAIFLLTTTENSYNGVFRLIIGISVIIYSLIKLNISSSLTGVSLYIILLSSGLLLMYSCWFIIATLAFWVEKLDNINQIIPGFRRILQIPRSVFTGAFSTVLTVLIPLALIASVPSEVLLGRSNLIVIIWLLISTVLTGFAGRIFFNFSIKKYSSVGS